MDDPRKRVSNGKETENSRTKLSKGKRRKNERVRGKG